MAIIPYARVSSGKQVEGLSMSLQSDDNLLQQIATQYSTTVSSLFYHDAGVSSFKGKNAKEGELSRLLRDIEHGVIRSGDIVVMRALDRLSRQNLTASEVLYNTIINAGVLIHTTIDNHLYKKDDPMSSILATLALKTANEESAKKSHLTNRNASFRIQQAKNNERSECGCSWDVGIGRYPFWITTDNKKIIKHPVNWKHARHMVDLTLNGAGVSTVQRYAHSVGLELSYSAVGKMFNNKSVYGVLEINHQDEDHVINDYYPALCTEEEYYKIRAIKDSQTKVSNAGRKKVSILGGIQKLYCSCGFSMCIARNVKHQIEYYRCVDRLNKCFPYIKQELLDRIVLHSITTRQWNKTDNEDGLRLKALELELETKSNEYRSEQAFVLQHRDLFDETMMSTLRDKKAALQELEDKVEAAKLEVAKTEVNLDFDYTEAISFYQEHCDQLDSYIQGDNELKQEVRDLVCGLIERITVDHRNLIKIQFKDGLIEYYVLLRRRDQKKVHQRYYVKLQVVSTEEYQSLIEHFPELVNVVTEDMIDSLDIYYEDVVNPIPVTPIKEVDHAGNFMKHFTGLHEWKRQTAMSLGCTTTEWQQFKDINVADYGFQKKDIQITTKHYTKQKKTIVFKEYNESEVLELFGCLKVE
ncbi:recombinase family protein [Vibrio vulnificus]|uniref:recombinase family protein n=1 Tax=Vibrio vulnificus TaxID=672 RepID=UPI003242AF76